MSYLYYIDLPTFEPWDYSETETAYTARSFVVLCISYLLTTTMFALRVFVRARAKTAALEDVFTITAWISYTITFGIALGWLIYWTIKPYDPYGDAISEHACEIAAFIFQLINVWTTKASVVCLLLEVVGTRSTERNWKRTALIATFGLYSLFTVACLILGGASFGVNNTDDLERYARANGLDDHLRYYDRYELSFDSWRRWRSPWTPEIGTLMAWCFFSAIQNISYGVNGLLAIIWKQRSVNQRMGFVTLFGIGLLAAIFVAIRGGYAWFVTPRIWESLGYGNYVWALLEGPVLMDCGNLARLLPLWQWWVQGKPIRPAPAAFLHEPNVVDGEETRDELTSMEMQDKPLLRHKAEDQLATTAV